MIKQISLFFGLSFLALSWCLPGHYPPWASFQEQWVAAFGCVLICTAAGFGDARPRLRMPAITILFLICAIVPLVQRAAGMIPFFNDAILPFLYIAGFAICIIAGAALALQSREEWAAQLSAVFVCAGLISTGIALIQWLQIPHGFFVADLRPGERPYSNLAQANQYATLTCLALIGLMYAYETNRSRGTFTAVAVAILTFGLVMAQSRTSWLVVIVVASWWIQKRRDFAFRVTTPRCIIWSIAFVTAICLWGPLNAVADFSVPSLTQRLDGGKRMMHWLVLADAAFMSPWTGYGWLQIATAQQAAALFHPPVHEMLQDSHNVLIDIAIWVGIPLALALMGCFFSWLFIKVRRCDDKTEWTLLACIGAVLTHALLEYPLDYTFFLFPLGLLLGSLKPPHNPYILGTLAVPKWIYGATCAAMLCMLLWIGQEYLTVEDAFRQLRLSMIGAPANFSSSVPEPDVQLLEGPRKYHRFWLTPARRGMSRDELNSMRSVMQRNASPPAMLRYALAAGLNDRPSDAETTLSLICSMYVRERCKEARESWNEAQHQYPELVRVPSPIAK